MKRRSLRNAGLSLLAATAVAAAGIGTAYGYFTTYAEAKGGYTIELGDVTRIQESFDSWTKHVAVVNTEGQPVYVRAKAFSGTGYDLIYSNGTENGRWNLTPDAEGYYYYTPIVYGKLPDSDPEAASQPASEYTTDVLNVKIENIPVGEDGEVPPVTEFNVIVIYESTPVLYDADGNPYADWSHKVDVVEQEVVQ